MGLIQVERDTTGSTLMMHGMVGVARDDRIVVVGRPAVSIRP